MGKGLHSVHSVEPRQCDIDYFGRGQYENPRFWARLGGQPLFENLKVMDVGCGHGSLSVDIALAGAQRVLGLDINPHLIEFAKENLRRNYPHLQGVIEFRNIDLKDCSEYDFDAIVSKDTFEHVIDLEGMISEMSRRLKPGGKIYTGFGPLYNAPDGDHGRTQLPIFWGHVVLGEAKIIERLNRRGERTINSIHDLGLNGWSLQDYKRVFRESGLSIIFFRVNQSAHLSWPYRIILAFFSLMREIPCLQEYFSVNIYCTLEKQANEFSTSWQ